MEIENREKERELLRVPFKGDILINGNVKAKGIDITQDGLYVASDKSFKFGSDLIVTFLVLGKKLTVKAIVTHSESQIGLGLKFDNLKKDQKEIINKYIEDMDAGKIQFE